MGFRDGLRERAFPLATLDPAAPLDDLEPLLGLVGGARVVALGESAHFCAEYNQARERLLRFLVERAGFDVFAFEYGFSEGFRHDAWLRGETGGELDTTGEIPVGLEAPLRRMREHNLSAGFPVRFAGLDIPAAGGDLRPALDPVAEYLGTVDPDALPLVNGALEIAGRFGGDGLTADTSGRDVYLASSVLWHLEHAGQDRCRGGQRRGRLRHRRPRSERGRLRGLPEAGAPDQIRVQSIFLHTPVAEAFDAVLHVPEATVEKGLDI